MGSDRIQASVELAQLELIQRLGRIGYWEYDPRRTQVLSAAAVAGIAVHNDRGLA
jgi:hypothetical protein